MGKSDARSIGTGFQVWPALDADPDLLDPPIRPLVQALNRTGWALTVFSCAAHPEEPDSIEKGRRQAHIDLLISNLPVWHSLVRTLKRTTRGVRITEAPLGPTPPWLLPSLPPGSWHYHRLVLEPTPYTQPPETCRITLDRALTAALTALGGPGAMPPVDPKGRNQ